jgi:hypothetical protein
MTTDTLRKGIGGRSEDIAREACSLTIRNTLPKGAFALQTASRVVPPLRTASLGIDRVALMNFVAAVAEKGARHASQSEFRSLRGKLARSGAQ